jgi:hypothetical protein
VNVEGGFGSWRQRRAAKKAEGRRRWEQSQREREQGVVTMPCRFMGGTTQPTGVSPGQSYWLKLGLDALELSDDYAESPMLTIPWSSVADIIVEDGSESRIRTDVKHHSYGWFGGLFRLAPVGITESSQKARSYMGVQSEQGEFLFELGWEAASLRGRILQTKPRWRTG